MAYILPEYEPRSVREFVKYVALSMAVARRGRDNSLFTH
jgi:hypothetical protein